MKQQHNDITIPDDVLEGWQQLVDILAKICDVPAGLIMRYREPSIEVLLASQSAGNPYQPGHKETFKDSGLYCETVIKTQNKLLVPDALADEEWKTNPDVALQMISYLGFPIFLPDGRPFGTICLLDRKRNDYSETVEQLMIKFKDLIEKNLELLYVNQRLGDKNRRLTDYLMEIQALRGIVSICSNCKAIKDPEGSWQPVERYLAKNPEVSFSHGICPKCLKEHYPDVADGE